ncbi:MAG: hypothetical protein HQM01_15865, partial [Magnetococcales bacterium]|nr:hypothetical protein [Magnetococcales bacterium]
VLTLGVALFVQWHLARDRGALRELERERQRLTNRVTELSALYPLREPKPALAHELERLEQEKNLKSRMLTMFQDGRVGSDKGFVGYFREMATTSQGGAWLTGIGIYEGGREILLEGAASRNKPESIPAAIQAIVRRPVFAAYRFSHLHIQPVEEGSELLRFQARTGTDRELERFWEKKARKEPEIMEKARKAVEEDQERLKKMSKPLGLPLGEPPGARKGGTP